MESESEEDSTQPPEHVTPQHFPVEILDTQGFSQQSSEDEQADEKTKMKFDDHFDPNCSHSKPLKRHFTSKINKNTHPYYTPEGMNCCYYSTIIIKMFKTYTQQLLQAQRESKTTVPWGKPVMPGRHYSKTIDFKKRGCLSINMDSSADENENISPRNLSPDVFNFEDVSKFELEKRTLTPSEKEKRQPNFEEVKKPNLHKGTGDAKLDDYNIETQIYNEIQSSENEAEDDSDFVPEKESSKQRRSKPKATVKRKRKKSISPIRFTPKKTPQKIVSDFFKQIDDSQSPSIDSKSSQWLSKDSKSSQSNSKKSKSSQSNSKDSKSSQSRFSSKDDLIPGSQDSNEIFNSQGDIYSTQVAQQKRTPKLEKPARKKAKVEKRRISISSDDELLEKHLKEVVSVKKIKLNPISTVDKDDIFDDGDSKIKSLTTRTYQRKDRNKKTMEVESKVDFDQLLSLPTLHYSPSSSQKSTSPKNSQTDRENVASQFFSKIPGDMSDISSESPLKTVKKRKPFSLWDSVSEDELDSNLIKHATSNQSKTVGNVKPMQRLTPEENRPSTSQVTSPSRQSNVNVVTPIRRREIQPELISNQEENEVAEVIECPLCGNNFSLTMIERHAATCGDEDNSEEEDIQTPAREDVERQTRSKIFRN